MIYSKNGKNTFIGIVRAAMRFGIDYVKKGLSAFDLLVRDCGLISYADTVVDGFMEDQVGDETRVSIKAKYILGDGILTADIGLLNEPLTYLDADTLLDVAGTTDGSGFFTFPNTKKVADIKITSIGDYFKFEEGAGDTIADHVNGRISKLSATPTWVEVNNIESLANQQGYSVANGVNNFWDALATDPIEKDAIIPNEGVNSVAYYVEADFRILDDTLQEKDYSDITGGIIVVPPTDLTDNWVPPIDIYLMPDGSYASDFDVSDYKFVGKKYYVDIVTGLDTNDGLTALTAFKTIKEARTKVDLVEMHIANGTYNNDDAFQGATMRVGTSMIGTGDNVKITNAIPATWSKTGGFTNVYESTMDRCSNVTDMSILVYQDQDYTTLLEVGSIALVDSTQGSWFWDGVSKMYVHTPDSRVPDSDIVTYKRTHVLRLTTGAGNYIENVNIEGGYLGGLNSITNTYMKNCTAKYAGAAGCYSTNVVGFDSFFQNCIASSGQGDGFSHDNQNIIEFNCVARNNGDSASDQGSTCHGGVQVVRFADNLFNNFGPGVTDVTAGTVAWNVFCLSYKPLLGGQEDWEKDAGSIAYLEGCITTVDTLIDTRYTQINMINDGIEVSTDPFVVAYNYESPSGKAVPTYTKRATYNYVITDISGTPIIGDFASPNYFKIDQFYAEVFIADTTFILYDAAGVAKVIEIATVTETTNDQMFINKITKQIGFFSTSLTGDCLVKAEDFFNTLTHLLTEGGDATLTEDGDNLAANH
jgi:hypothetical protein